MKPFALWMKKAALIAAAFSFFGVIYPRFNLVADTYKVVYTEEWDGEESGEIRVKSKLWEWLQTFWEKE